MTQSRLTAPGTRRLGALVAAIALVSTGLGALTLRPAVADQPQPDPCPNALACGDDLSAMGALETAMADHFIWGKAVPVTYATAQRIPGDIVSSDSWGDSGLWTGVYLGGEAYRYAVAKHYLSLQNDPGNSAGQGQADSAPGHSALSPDQQAFWTAQRDQALSRVQAILAGEHRDVNIAEDWQGQLIIPPEVNTQDPGGEHLLNFGGGAVPGQAGMLMRACTPAGSYPFGVNPPDIHPNNPVANNSNRVFEITWKSGDGVTYDCETSPSRDTYAGVVFGMLTAFDMVSPDFPQMRAQIRDDLLAMGNFLIRYAWNYPRPQGYVSAQSDFDGFFSPLFVYVPLARLNVTNAVRHVADLAGSPADAQRWDAIWNEEFATQGPAIAGQMQVDAGTNHDDGYYGLNLDHLNAFDLLRTVSDPERSVIADGFAVEDKTTRPDLNAHFEALTYGVTGDGSRLSDAVTHLGQWLQYRNNTQDDQLVHNSSRCGGDLTCVPTDQYDFGVDQAPGGEVAWYPGQPATPVTKAAAPRSTTPLPVAERPPTDFLWQRPPTALDGQQPATYSEPGIDYLAPYWLLRYFTEVAPPADQPLPTWPGPASR